MIINEIFDTKVDVSWKESANGFRGKFTLEDHLYEIRINEYEADLSKRYSLIDIGFTRDDEWSAANEDKR